MHSRLNLQGPLGPGNMALRDFGAVLTHARALQRAADSGATQPLLRGKKLGLLCDRDDAGEAALFRRAAVELGAHVAHVRPSLSEASTEQEVLNLAQLLGRLYDAVECQGMAPALVRRVGESAGVPVYDGIAAATHPTAALCSLLEGDAAPADKRRFVLQAVLVSTID